MNKAISILICCCLPLVALASESFELTDWLYWQDGPATKQIRAIYNEVNAAEKAGKLKKEYRKCELYDGSFIIEGMLYKDQNGVVRKYAVISGSDDSIQRSEYYYDAKGIPRFTYRYNGSVYESKKWDRIYFDEKGEHLCTLHKEEGPGNLKDIIKNPAEHYADLGKK